MKINHEKLMEKLKKNGLKDDEVNLFIKDVSDEEEEPKQETPAEETKEEPKQDGGEPEKPVEDKTGETPKAQKPNEGGEGGGEPEPHESEAAKGFEKKLNDLEAEVRDMKSAIEGRDKKIETYEQLLAKIGLPTDGKDPKQFGGNKSDDSQDNPVKGNVEANVKTVKELLGYTN